MPKCQNCRKAPVQDSLWDKIRLFGFRFFHNDIIDLSQDKFTQGFADGYQKGKTDERQASDKRMAEFMAEPAEQPLPLPIVDLNKIVTEHNGRLFINGIAIDSKKLDTLKQEAFMFKNSTLWELITNTLNQQAYEAGWVKSKDLTDFLTGKTISYTIGVQSNIIKKIERAK